MDADVVVVGAGLAGLVATCELAGAGHSVVLLDQEGEANLGGQAWWSFGGLFLVDTPEQRRLGIRDSVQLAWQDWEGTAGWDRLTAADGGPGPDHWGREWARAYVDWAAGEKRPWLRSLGLSFFPQVGWAERGDGTSGGHGNSVPRFHVPWGTGTGVVAPFEQRVREHIAAGRVIYRPRHRVDAIVRTGSAVDGGARRGPRSRRLAPRGGVEPRGGRRLRVRRPGRGGHLRWDRGRPRPRAGALAGAARHAARRDAHRCPRVRRRPDARDHRGGGRRRRQPRPDVALRRGRAELRPRLA